MQTAMDQGENYMVDDQIKLSFKFKLPLDEVKRKHPYAQFILRTTCFTP